MAAVATAPVPTMSAAQRRKHALSTMQSSLAKYAKANDRRMVIRSMREVKELTSILLDPIETDTENLDELEQEIYEENSILLNGIPFHGSKHFLMTLKELCVKLCATEGIAMTSDELYAALVTRMGRSASSADAYFKLNSLMGSADVMLLPKNDTFPIKVNLYASAGEVHATVHNTNAYGMYRKADVKPADIKKGVVGNSRPWIALQATVDERANLSTGNAVRILKVKLPDSLY